ncbi:MAG: SpoIID/LytB domain-containing protein [Nitrospiria bacterium]
MSADQPHPFSLFLVYKKMILSSFIIALTLLFSPLSLQAEETLRVSLMSQVKQLTFTSRKGFSIMSSSGKRIGPLKRSARISLSRQGIAIDRVDSREKELLFIPRRGGRVTVNGNAYGGTFRIIRKEEGLLVLNEVELEQYLKGVVPAEMPSTWKMEALKVQAVISRTYALYKKGENRENDFDLVGSILAQAYKGASLENRRTSAAVDMTKGMILSYEGAPALTFFHSTSAGPTEDAAERWDIDLPYLKGVSCPLDRESPYHQWKKTITLSDLESALRDKGFPVRAVATLTPLKFSRAGRLLTVRILYNAGEIILKAEDLRQALGYSILPSTNFRIDSFGKDIEFQGMGFGHGVGLCQWGTKVLAEKGFNFEKILLYYYPGVTLQAYEALPSFH